MSHYSGFKISLSVQCKTRSYLQLLYIVGKLRYRRFTVPLVRSLSYCAERIRGNCLYAVSYVVIAIHAQYHSCCYQNRFTTITNTLALASPRILEDVSVLKSCCLHCEILQHEILSERVRSRSCSGCDGHLLFQEGLGSFLSRCAAYGSILRESFPFVERKTVLAQNL